MQTQNQKNFADADSTSEELLLKNLINIMFLRFQNFRRDGTGRDGKGRDGKGRDGTGQDGTGRDGRDGKERDRMGGRADQGMWELLGTWMGGGGGEAARIRPNPP